MQRSSRSPKDTAGTHYSQALFAELDERSREIFQQLVQVWFESGVPVGSRTLAKALESGKNKVLSPATIRNSLADLQQLGLLEAPHSSAARHPTAMGIRLFVDTFLQTDALSQEQAETIAAHLGQGDRTLKDIPELLNHLTHQASFVLTRPRTQPRVLQIEFVPLPGKILAILVSDDGTVTNRIFAFPRALPPSALVEVGNYLSTKLQQGESPLLPSIIHDLKAQMASTRDEADALIDSLVARGVDLICNPQTTPGYVLVRGYGNLIDDNHAARDIERLQELLLSMEKGECLLDLSEKLNAAQDVSIFIGAANDLFEHTGWSVVMAPIREGDQVETIGAIGIIGPSAMNYRRIVPVVTCTAELMAGMIDRNELSST